MSSQMVVVLAVLTQQALRGLGSSPCGFGSVAAPFPPPQPSHFVEIPILLSSIRSDNFSSYALNGSDSKADFS